MASFYAHANVGGVYFIKQFNSHISFEIHIGNLASLRYGIQKGSILAIFNVIT